MIKYYLNYDRRLQIKNEHDFIHLTIEDTGVIRGSPEVFILNIKQVKDLISDLQDMLIVIERVE